MEGGELFSKVSFCGGRGVRLKWVNKFGFSGEEGLSCMGVGGSVELVLRVGQKCLFIGVGGG
jgi:hypothetical protein